MSETIESTRRWSGYVCPDCRFVFRVPRDHDGAGIVCPSCRRMLRIPGVEDTPPPLMAPLRRVSEEERTTDEEHEGMVKKRRRGRKHRGGGDPSWENQSHSGRSGKGEKRQMNLLLVGGVVLLAGALGTAAFLMKAKDRGTANAQHDPVAAPADLAPDVSGDHRPRKSDVDLLAEAEPLVRKFMEAGTVEQLLPLVRHPAVTGPRLKEFYPDGKIAAQGLAKFNATDGLSRIGDMMSMSVMNAKFEQRELVFFDTAEGVKIDWESWVGWSEMPWEDFRAGKPSTATLFRVTLAPVAYYNFGFTDDSKWQSYRLISPDGEQAIYGYVEKGSDIGEKIRLDPDVKKAPMTLSLRFPAGATTDNQVEIVGFVADGWVETEDPR